VIDDPTATVPGTGFETGPWAEPGSTTADPVDDAAWEGAWVQIESPTADGLVPLDAPFAFEAVIYGPNGAPIDAAPERVRWFASGDPDFEGDSLAFTAEPMAVGTHEITVIVDLPTGDRLAHTVGGVKVQSPVAGTYAGLFSVDGTVNNVTITCTGAAVIAIDEVGQAGDGGGDCIVSILGIDVPMSWDFALDAPTADELTGEAAVDLIGFFSYDVPMTAGTIDPEGVGLDLAFDTQIPFVGTVSASLEAPRISLDTE
jgi:hypothetical protein